MSNCAVFLLSLLPLAKIVLGTMASFYFDNSWMGGWWVGVACWLLFPTKWFLGEKYSCNSGIAVLGGLFVFGICVFGTLFDTLVAVYFDQMPSKCRGLPLEHDRCYCSASEDIFNRIFQEVGDLDCYNPYTRETSYLIANAVMSGLCAVVALYLCMAALHTCVTNLFGCGTSQRERLVN